MAIAFFFAPLSASAAPFDAGLGAFDREHYATAFRAWKEMAETGVAQAQNNIGYLYEYGRGVKQSYADAIEWYSKAAEQDLPEAHHNLGMLAFYGYGMRQDYVAAKRFFTAAAELEQADSMYMLGLIYYQAHGVVQNVDRAMQHFVDAANHGSAKGQFMASYLFLGGENHPNGDPEPVKAFIWAQVAKMNGYADAQTLIDFSRLQLNDSVEGRAIELAQNCYDSNYSQCPS